MLTEDARKVLEYLKEGKENTFRLARELDIKRSKLLDLIKKLEEKGAVEVTHGVVRFIKFISEGEKAVKPEVKKLTKKILSPKKKPKAKKAKVKPGALKTENKELKEKVLRLEGTIKKLEGAPPKTITKTIIKKVPVTKTIIKKIHVPLPPEKKKVRRKKRKKAKKKAKKEKKKKFLERLRAKKKAKKKSKKKSRLLKGLSGLNVPETLKEK